MIEGRAGRPWLWAWCLGTAVAVLGFMIYLPVSSRLEAQRLSEDPWPLTLAMLAGAGASVVIWWRSRAGPLFPLRATLAVGALLAVVGNVNYLHYVYYYSQELAPAAGAPDVGDVAPDFTVQTPEGGPWSLSDWQGRSVLLVFYRAHW